MKNVLNNELVLIEEIFNSVIAPIDFNPPMNDILNAYKKKKKLFNKKSQIYTTEIREERKDQGSSRNPTSAMIQGSENVDQVFDAPVGKGILLRKEVP